MINWLKNNFRKKIDKRLCLCFPVIPKEKLIDGHRYEFIKIKKDISASFKMETDFIWWNREIERFVSIGKLYKYEDILPLRDITGFEDYKKPFEKCVVSYNPSTICQFDLEELRKITFELSDDNTESDEIWDKLIKYFEDRGIGY